MVQIVVGEGHPKACGFDFREVFDQRFELFVIHHVDVFFADLREVKDAFVRERRGSLPGAVFPVAGVSGDFADVDFGVEVGGKGQAVVAGVGVDDVEFVDFIEQVFLDIGGEDVSNAGVKTAAEQRHDAALTEAVFIGPLPFVFEFGFFRRFVVGGVEVVNAGSEAGIHDVQILVGQGDVKDELRAQFFEQAGKRGDVVGINLAGINGHAVFCLDGSGDGVAFRQCPACQGDLVKGVFVFGAFVGDDVGDATGADDKDVVHMGSCVDGKRRF